MDAYDLHARRTPVAIVVLPAFVLLALSVLDASTFGVATGAVVSICSVIGAQVGRDRGRKLQPLLWSSWGGALTTQALRWNGPSPKALVGQRHTEASRALKLTLPSERVERGSPAEADEAYAAAVSKLIALTRDHRTFRLVSKENVNYGFRRNCLGLRPFGLFVCGAVVLLAGVLLFFGGGEFGGRALHYGWCLGIAVALGLFWLVVVGPDWVRIPADAYASRLMEAMHQL